MLDVDLHGFGHPSRVAHGAVIYVRSVCRHGGKVSFWTGKRCVAPVKRYYGTKVRIVGLHLFV